MRRQNESSTQLLLTCGALAGPLFILTVLVQDYTRAGFDPRVHMLSLLSLGRFGWIQVTNFIVTGCLDMLYAVGLRRRFRDAKFGAASPFLIYVHGAGLVLVGLFRTDPSAGFPPGVASVPAPTPSGMAHALGALVVFVSLAAGLIALSRSFAARRYPGWALYSLGSSVVMVYLFFAGFVFPDVTARTLRLAVLIGWSAASVVAMRLLRDAHDSSRAVVAATVT